MLPGLPLPGAAEIAPTEAPPLEWEGDSGEAGTGSLANRVVLDRGSDAMVRESPVVSADVISTARFKPGLLFSAGQPLPYRDPASINRQRSKEQQAERSFRKAFLKPDTGFYSLLQLKNTFRPVFHYLTKGLVRPNLNPHLKLTAMTWWCI
ncbi:hypothetical protein [Oecophyllibacter saccharovorans]|uniref:Uncharacterized protein n=1 Tax=Oecophyllibacter saccharovorans TaxID=2558360 RepID=A0A506ULL7_9PROT|nr:hypothetical protein [Oecophyllibacter saccharovorans]TPW34063.1 hypothetical protein E3202_05820 [Oecophyllibacter saccharovorans]